VTIRGPALDQRLAIRAVANRHLNWRAEEPMVNRRAPPSTRNRVAHPESESSTHGIEERGGG
jgi:hypothetical protein